MIPKMIEKHPDFSLTPHALELIDPEIREDQELTRRQLKDLAERTNKPLKDFTWQTSGKKTKISEMDLQFLLVTARHCVHRANFYHDKVSFFIGVLEIVEEHARAKGIEVPETVEEIQAMLEDMQRQEQPVTASQAPQPAPPAKQQDEIVLDNIDPGLLKEIIESSKAQKESAS